MNPNEMNPQDLAKLQEAVSRQAAEEMGASPLSATQTAGLKDRIKALEDELSGIPREAVKSQAETLKTYLDEYGQETFYVKNVSGTHVVISDLSMDPIPKGGIVDLLTLAQMEDLKKSRDLKNAVSPYSRTRMLVRLTPQEYYEEKESELSNKKKIAIMREQMDLQAKQRAEKAAADPFAPPPTSNPSTPERQQIRAEIHSKLGKLSLIDSRDPEKFSMAMTSVEFIEWVFASNLNSTEIDFILGDPVVSRSSDIRTALLQKRATLPS
jgi:hypothetical protein